MSNSTVVAAVPLHYIRKKFVFEPRLSKLGGATDWVMSRCVLEHAVSQSLYEPSIPCVRVCSFTSGTSQAESVIPVRLHESVTQPLEGVMLQLYDWAMLLQARTPKLQANLPPVPDDDAPEP